MQYKLSALVGIQEHKLLFIVNEIIVILQSFQVSQFQDLFAFLAQVRKYMYSSYSRNKF